MGFFSWKFADTKNKKRLIIEKAAYVLCPDGTVLYEPWYNGYGIFAGKDIYDLVADWNREFLSRNPDFIVKSENKKVCDFVWYPKYSDLTLTPREIERQLREEGKWHSSTEFRDIGISIACEDENNKALPYPIKICQSQPEGSPDYYRKLPASKGDPRQGCY